MNNRSSPPVLVTSALSAVQQFSDPHPAGGR